jgi:myosin-crossreactive antigen
MPLTRYFIEYQSSLPIQETQKARVTKMANTQKQLRILIAGAGIAGLATAISLTRISEIANLDIRLYEQAAELQEIGASIALSPNVGFVKPMPRAYLCLWLADL